MTNTSAWEQGTVYRGYVYEAMYISEGNKRSSALSSCIYIQCYENVWAPQIIFMIFLHKTLFGLAIYQIADEHSDI